MRSNKFFLIIWGLFLGLFLVFGCAATKKIKDDILGADVEVKRKIGFFSGTNASGRGGGTPNRPEIANVENKIESSSVGHHRVGYFLRPGDARLCPVRGGLRRPR